MNLGISDFFKDIKGIFGPSSALGVDIGTASIKIVELAKRGDEVTLKNYGILETKGYFEHTNQAIQTSSLKLVEKDVIRLITTLLREMKTSVTNAVVSIPPFSAFMTVLDMPVLSDRETTESISFQARQYVPLPPSEVTIDWQKVGEFDNERGVRQQRVLLIGIPKEIIEKYRVIFRSVGLRVATLEVENFALLRSLRGADVSPTISVDIGAEATNIVVSERGIFQQGGESDYGGIYLSQAISRAFGISVSRAEELKRRRGLLGTGGETELSTSMLPFLDVIIQEVEHVKDSYERRYKKSADRLVLTGGGANLLGIEKYFSAKLNIPLLPYAPLGGVQYATDIEPVMKNLNHELIVACGLARKFFE